MNLKMYLFISNDFNLHSPNKKRIIDNSNVSQYILAVILVCNYNDNMKFCFPLKYM